MSQCSPIFNQEIGHKKSCLHQEIEFFLFKCQFIILFRKHYYLVATKLKWERWKWKDIEDRKTPEVGAWRKVYLSSLWTSLFNFVFPRQLSHFKLQDKKTQQCSAVFVMENIIWSFYRSICLPSSAHFLFLSSFFLFSFLFLSLLFTEGTQKREKRNQVFRYNKQFIFQKNIWEGGTKRNLFSSSVSHKSQTNMNISESRRLFHMLLVYQVCFFWSNEQKLLSAVAEHWNTLTEENKIKTMKSFYLFVNNCWTLLHAFDITIQWSIIEHKTFYFLWVIFQCIDSEQKHQQNWRWK